MNKIIASNVVSFVLVSPLALIVLMGIMFGLFTPFTLTNELYILSYMLGVLIPLLASLYVMHFSVKNNNFITALCLNVVLILAYMSYFIVSDICYSELLMRPDYCSYLP
jgi:hypothetical protein